MRFIGRTIRIFLALMVAIAVAVVFLPIAIFADPKLRDFAHSLTPDIIEFFAFPILAPELFLGFVSGMFALFWLVSIAICVAPVTIVAVLGELGRVRSLAWYGGVTALLAGAMPWILRSAKGGVTRPDAVTQAMEYRLILFFCLTGLAAGLVYWLLAGRSTGSRARSG